MFCVSEQVVERVQQCRAKRCSCPMHAVHATAVTMACVTHRVRHNTNLVTSHRLYQCPRGRGRRRDCTTARGCHNLDSVNTLESVYTALESKLRASCRRVVIPLARGASTATLATGKGCPHKAVMGKGSPHKTTENTLAPRTQVLGDLAMAGLGRGGRVRAGLARGGRVREGLARGGRVRGGQGMETEVPGTVRAQGTVTARGRARAREMECPGRETGRAQGSEWAMALGWGWGRARGLQWLEPGQRCLSLPPHRGVRPSTCTFHRCQAFHLPALPCGSSRSLPNHPSCSAGGAGETAGLVGGASAAAAQPASTCSMGAPLAASCPELRTLSFQYVPGAPGPPVAS